MAEINVTPLVDVMLVLLIIFMVTAPMLAAGVPVDRRTARLIRWTSNRIRSRSASMRRATCSLTISSLLLANWPIALPGCSAAPSRRL